MTAESRRYLLNAVNALAQDLNGALAYQRVDRELTELESLARAEKTRAVR